MHLRMMMDEKKGEKNTRASCRADSFKGVFQFCQVPIHAYKQTKRCVCVCACVYTCICISEREAVH